MLLLIDFFNSLFAFISLAPEPLITVTVRSEGVGGPKSDPEYIEMGRMGKVPPNNSSLDDCSGELTPALPDPLESKRCIDFYSFFVILLFMFSSSDDNELYFFCFVSDDVPSSTGEYEDFSSECRFRKYVVYFCI